MAQAQEDCRADSPCAVTTDQQTGKTTVRKGQRGVPPVATNGAATSTQAGKSMYRQIPGREALSLEEAATSYFEHVAAADRSLPGGGGRPFDPKNVLWDRGNLTDTQAAEVLEVARRLNPPGTPRGDDAKLNASQRQLCQDLVVADNPDAQVAAFEASEARAAAREKAAGRTILDQLSQATHASVLEVLDKHRDSITVNRADWKKVRTSNPELLTTQSKRACTRAN
jgi:hypothetical protein